MSELSYSASDVREQKKPWGRSEFHLVVPSGVCFQFYEHEVP